MLWCRSDTASDETTDQRSSCHALPDSTEEHSHDDLPREAELFRLTPENTEGAR